MKIMRNPQKSTKNVQKKSLGQNFLRDKGILKKIADFARIEKTDTVVEVGPGEGTLTEFLLERAEKLIAIEKDEKMVEFLKEKFKEEIKKEKLEIIEKDVLNLELEKSSVNEPCERDWREHEEFSSKKISVRENRSFFPVNKFILVGNIPYYITGALFKKFLEAENQPQSITFVVQKEVAERIMGSHFTKATRDKKESILSISIKVYGTPEYGGVIKAGSFSPKPKVDSAIISIREISKKKFEESGIEEKKFFEILKTGFAHKRKLLIRNLDKFRKVEKLKEIFGKCGIAEKARAENLEVSDWICLTKELQNN
jgi:16S rRNA (adenine1518-N6/adenine1519-N6)-dimethyltransferase